MKIEREARFESINLKETVKRLRALDARKGYDGVMRITSYDIGTQGVPMMITTVGVQGNLSLIDTVSRRFLEASVQYPAELRAAFDTIGFVERNGAYTIPNSLKSIEDRKMRLRLRSKGKTVHDMTSGELTLKMNTRRRAVDGTTTKAVRECTEYETTVLPYGECREILRHAGMRELRPYDKRRIEYHVPGDVSVALDTIRGVPTYLEIEGKTIDDIARTAESLGLRMQDASLLSTRELRKKYRVG